MIYKHLLSTMLLLIGYASISQTITENISFNHGSCTFSAVLTKPSGSGPFQAIVIIPGSGQNDKDGTLTLSGGNSKCLYPNLEDSTLTPYKDLAFNLSDSGFAVLRYDELTISCPGFSGALSYDQLWLPANSALDYLKTRSDVDTTQFIIIGHSEGSTIMPYIASKRNDIKAMISIGGARTPFDSILEKQLIDFTKICNGDTNAAQAQAQQIRNYFDLVRGSNYTSSTPAFGGVKPATWEKYLHVNDSVAVLYQNNNIASLFIGMGMDLNVPLSELNRFRNELSGSFYTIPNLLHYMVPYNKTQVSRKLTDTIVYWLKNERFTFSTDEIEINNNLSVYPNPFTDKMSLNLKTESNLNVVLVLLSIQGELLWEERLTVNDLKAPLNLPYQKMSDGIYFLKGIVGSDRFQVKIHKK